MHLLTIAGVGLTNPREKSGIGRLSNLQSFSIIPMSAIRLICGKNLWITDRFDISLTDQVSMLIVATSRSTSSISISDTLPA